MKTKHIHSRKSQSWKANLKLSTMLCGLALLAPQLAMAVQGNQKAIKVCNNFPGELAKPIWFRLSSTPVGGKEVLYPDAAIKVESGRCESQMVTPEHYNAGRAFIFDRDPKLSEYLDKGLIRTDGNFQLVEYTFRDRNHPDPNGDGVGFNYSSVDSNSAAIPLAVQATDLKETREGTCEGMYDKSCGYTGNLMDADPVKNAEKLKALNAAMDKFINAGWPYYPAASNCDPNNRQSCRGPYRIPGAYNLFAQADSMVENPVTKKLEPMLQYKAGVTPITAKVLTDKWLNWVNGKYTCSDQFCRDFQASVKKVWFAFKENARLHGLTGKDQEEADLTGAALDAYNMNIARHITGYVNFNDVGPYKGNKYNDWEGIDNCVSNDRAIKANCNDKVGHIWIALAQGIPAETPEYSDRKFPDYNSQYSLDPYVTAIHRDFKINAYAFSIDDFISYFDVPKQDQLIIAVGGLNGLVVKTQSQKDPASKYGVSSAPGWHVIDSCGFKKELIKTDQGYRTPLQFKKPGTSCEVKMASEKPKVSLNMTIKLSADGQMEIEKCTVDKNGAENVKCSNSVMVDNNSKVDVVVPVPSGS